MDVNTTNMKILNEKLERLTIDRPFPLNKLENNKLDLPKSLMSLLDTQHTTTHTIAQSLTKTLDNIENDQIIYDDIYGPNSICLTIYNCIDMTCYKIRYSRRIIKRSDYVSKLLFSDIRPRLISDVFKEMSNQRRYRNENSNIRIEDIQYILSKGMDAYREVNIIDIVNEQNLQTMKKIGKKIRCHLHTTATICIDV